MSDERYKKIAYAIEHDFPNVYREEGPMFVEFVKKYYEWMESENQAIYHARRLYDYKDIDHTVDQFIVFFKETYLKNIELDTATDVPRLIKHSLDLYRSRGTEQGMDLFFKLVYGVEPTFYYPSKDIFRLSSGDWVVPTYLEVAYRPCIRAYIGKEIIGMESGAVAFCASYVRRLISTNKYINVLYITNINGTFRAGESLGLRSGDPIEQPVPILGSFNTIEVDDGGVDFELGDIVTFTSSNGQQAKARVTALSTVYGAATFELIDGGYGFTANAIVSVTGGGPLVAATLQIGSLINTETIQFNSDVLDNYDHLQLQAASYGANLNSANVNTSLASALNFANLTIGEIGSIVVTNPGDQYLAAPTVTITEPTISQFGYEDYQFNLTSVSSDFQVGELVTQTATGARGRVRSWDGVNNVLYVKRMNFQDKWVVTSNSTTYIIGSETASQANVETIAIYDNVEMGMNANVATSVITSNSAASALEIFDSGFGYLEGEEVVFAANSGANGIGIVTLSSHGRSEGFYRTNGGFLSDDKKLYDGWYYQDFSYEIRSPISLDRYVDALKKLLHVSGTKYFGVIERRSDISSRINIENSSRTVS